MIYALGKDFFGATTFKDVRLLLWSLLNHAFGVLACSRALRVYVLPCLRAWRAWVLMCLRAYVLSVLACLRAWRACVLTCFCAWRACVLCVFTCLACLRAYVLGVLACVRAWLLRWNVLFSYVFAHLVFGVLFCLIFFTFQYLNLKILRANELCALLS